MDSGINSKINKFLCNPKNVKKRRNTRLEKCYGHVDIATAITKTHKLTHFTEKIPAVWTYHIVMKNCF